MSQDQQTTKTNTTITTSSAHNESSFQLQVEPQDKLRFMGNLLGEITIIMRLMNKSDARQAWKVKCTRNDLFRIRPAIGLLDCGQSADVTITYRCIDGKAPEADRHHFGIYHIPVPEGATAPSVWAEHYGAPAGEMKMPVAFSYNK